MANKKEIYNGEIQQDEQGNYYCGPYLLDYRMVADRFKIGDKITIRSVIENPSDKSYGQYPEKSKDFTAFDKKKFIKPDNKE